MSIYRPQAIKNFPHWQAYIPASGWGCGQGSLREWQRPPALIGGDS
jgi:hypothetical protein